VVLVVEDDWLVRDFLVSHLQEAGWRVLEADSAEQAIAMLKAGQHIDIVIASGNAPDPSRLVPESLFFRKPYDPDAILRSCQGSRRQWELSSRVCP